MHWKLKAAIQNALAVLPSSLSYASYYWLQRRFGGLRAVDPWGRLAAAAKTWTLVAQQGRDPRGKVFFEVGTGRTVIMPMAYWLMGAARTITIDLNPYLRRELILESIARITGSRARLEQCLGPLLDAQRFEELLALSRVANVSTKDVLELCHIDYLAPADAAQTGLPADTVDFHTSYTVFEHIPSEILLAILQEGTRVIRRDGLFVHGVDYTDHFSHSDRRISAVNFLQYSDRAWSRYAGNRYMYMNRLRHDDYERLFLAAGHRILATEPTTDPRSRTVLHSGSFRLDERFRAKSKETLAISSSWFVSESSRGSAG